MDWASPTQAINTTTMSWSVRIPTASVWYFTRGAVVTNTGSVRRVLLKPKPLLLVQATTSSIKLKHVSLEIEIVQGNWSGFWMGVFSQPCLTHRSVPLPHTLIVCLVSISYRRIRSTHQPTVIFAIIYLGAAYYALLQLGHTDEFLQRLGLAGCQAHTDHPVRTSFSRALQLFIMRICKWCTRKGTEIQGFIGNQQLKMTSSTPAAMALKGNVLQNAFLFCFLFGTWCLNPYDMFFCTVSPRRALFMFVSVV